MIFDGEILNYKNIAADCGVSAPTVKEYFTILEETLLGYALPAYTKTVKRRVIQASKFYLFDVGIVNYLTHRRNLVARKRGLWACFGTSDGAGSHGLSKLYGVRYANGLLAYDIGV